jgi:Yersinia/Haemophilus virulence surface antigen
MATGCVEQIYEQNKDPRWNKGHLEKGVCLALSAYWIIHKAQAGSIDSLEFWDWLGVKPNALNSKIQSYTPEAIKFLTEHNDISHMMTLQHNLGTVKDKLPGVEYRDIAKEAIPFRCGLMHLQDSGDIKFTNHDQFMRDMTIRYWMPGGVTYYHYIHMGGVDKQGAGFGHAVAVAYETKGRVYFFDPNAGEMSWSERDGDNGFLANDSLVKTVMASYYYPPNGQFGTLQFYNVSVFGSQ